MKIKCTQCGREDLVEVNFPMEVGFNNDGYESVKTNNPYNPYERKFVEREPVLQQTQYDGDGGAVTFKLENQYFCQTFICTECGHFEFFSKELTEVIKEDRKKCADLKKEIADLEDKITKLQAEQTKLQKELDSCNKEFSDLDITVRRSNELKEKINNLKNNITKKIETINELNKQKQQLENQLEEFEE